MDPVSLAGSIVGIIDIVIKSMKTLQSLQQQFKLADQSIASFLNQLDTLRIRIKMIETCMSSRLEGEAQDGGLQKTTSEILERCQSLIDSIQERFPQIDWAGASNQALFKKIEVVFRLDELNKYAELLNHQLTVSSVLLHALNRASPSERNCLLQGQEIRKSLDQLRDDAPSLIALKQNSSFHSTLAANFCVEETALISIRFDFDEELQSSTAYQRQMKAFLRDSIGIEEIPLNPVARITTFHQLDCYFKGQKLFQHGIIATRFCLEDKDIPSPIQIPIFGDQEDEIFMVMALLKAKNAFGSTFNIRDRTYARDLLRSNLISSIRYLLEIIEYVGVKHPSREFTECSDAILSIPVPSLGAMYGWSPEVAGDLEIICNEVELKNCYDAFTCEQIPGWDSYFFHSAARIARPEYVPTDDDIRVISLPNHQRGEAKMVCGGRSIQFVRGETYHRPPELNCTFSPLVIFIVDMSCNPDYHQTHGSDSQGLASRDLFSKACTTSVGQNNFSKFLHAYYGCMLNYKSQTPRHVIILTNTSTSVSSISTAKGCGIESTCFEDKISHIRQITQGQRLHIRHGEVVGLGAVDFIFETIEKVLVRDELGSPWRSMPDPTAAEPSEQTVIIACEA